MYVKCVSGLHSETKIEHNSVSEKFCHCFSCNETYDIFTYLKKYYEMQNLSYSFSDICRAIGDALGGASYYETEEKELQKHPFPLTKEECAIIGISTSSKKNTPNIYGMYEEEPKKIKNLVKKIAYESMNRYKILSEQVEDVNLREKYNELYKKSREIYEKLGGDNQKNVNLFNNL